MEIVYTTVMVLALIAILVGLVLMPFKTKRKRGLKMIGSGFLAVLVAGMGGAHENGAEAERLGFVSVTEMTRAKRHGISDAVAWKIKAGELEIQSVREGGFATVEEKRQAELAGFQTKAAWTRAQAEETFFRVPNDQLAFVAAANAAMSAYRSAPNDLAKGGVRAQRRGDMCRTIRGRAVIGWVGKITELTSNSDGKGVLSITLSPGITVKTWNNALSDVAHDTLIEAGTGMFAKLASLKIGQKVKFSGQFFESDVDCIFESSLTLQGAMTSPEFIMRFSSVQTP